MLIPNLPYKGLISPIAVIDVIKDVRYVQTPNKDCITEGFVTSKSDFLSFITNNWVFLKNSGYHSMPLTKTTIKIILLKSRFELFVNITSLRLEHS